MWPFTKRAKQPETIPNEEELKQKIASQLIFDPVTKQLKIKPTEAEPPASQEPTSESMEKNYWFFLSYFWNPQEIDRDKFISGWSESLGRSYKKVIDEFLSRGLIKRAGVKEKLAVLLRGDDLRSLLREKGLKTSGKKDDLLVRYIEACPEEAEKKASAMTGDLLVCTPEGARKVADIGRRADREDSAQLEMRHLLSRKKVEQAAEVVRVYKGYERNPLQENVVGKDEVEMVLAIKEMPGVAPEDFADARLNAAIEMLWYGKITSSEYSHNPVYHAVGRFAANAVEKERSRRVLKGYSEDEFITRVEIMCLDDSCRVCKAVAKRTYPLNKAPLIPIDGCTHESGCRCCYTPIVE